MLMPGPRFISTGVPELDDLLGGGGVPCGQLVEVVGQSSSGKTQICHRLAASASLHGLGVWFIDAKNSFCPRRLLGFLRRQKKERKPAHGHTLPPAAMPQIERDALRRVNVRKIFDVSTLLEDLTFVRSHFLLLESGAYCALGWLPQALPSCSLSWNLVCFACYGQFLEQGTTTTTHGMHGVTKDQDTLQETAVRACPRLVVVDSISALLSPASRSRFVGVHVPPDFCAQAHVSLACTCERRFGGLPRLHNDMWVGCVCASGPSFMRSGTFCAASLWTWVALLSPRMTCCQCGISVAALLVPVVVKRESHKPTLGLGINGRLAQVLRKKRFASSQRLEFSGWVCLTFAFNCMELPVVVVLSQRSITSETQRLLRLWKSSTLRRGYASF